MSVMLNILVVVVTFIGTIWLSSRLVALVVAWLCKKYGKLDVRVGGVGFFTYGNILISRGPLTLNIERLWFSSCYFNKEVSKPIAICIGEMRVEVDLPRHGTSGGRTTRNSSNTKKDLIRTESLVKYLTLVKFLGLHIDTVNVVLRGGVLADCLLHITVNEVTPDLDSANSQLLGVVQINGLVLKVLTTASQEEDGKPCLAEISFSTNLMWELTLVGKPSLELVHATICEPKLKVSEVLLAYIHDQRMKPHLGIPQVGVSRITDHSIESGSLDQRLLDYLPKKMSFEVESTEISLSKESSNRNLLLGITSILLDVQQRVIEGSIHASADIRLSDVKFGSHKANLAFLRELKMEMKLTDQSVDVSANLQSCFLGYHHEEVQYWFALLSRMRLKLPRIGSASAALPGGDAPVVSPPRRNIMSILGSRTLLITLKSHDMSAAVGMAACGGIKSGFTDFDFSMDIKPNISDEDGVGGRDVQLEVEVNRLYSKLSDGGPASVDLSPKMHHYNTLIYASIFMLKVNKISKQLSVDLMLDSVQVEVSTQSLSIISQMGVAIFRQSPLASPTLLSNPAARYSYSHQKLPPVPSQQCLDMLSGDCEDVKLTGVIQCTNVNIFFTAEQTVCTMLRVDSISVQERIKDVTATVQGSKVAYLTQIGAVQAICRSQDLHNYCGYVRQFTLEYTSRNKCMDIRLTEEVYVAWNTSLHMCVYQTITDCKSLQQKLAGVKECGSCSPPPLNQVSKPQSLPLKVSVTIRANAMVVLCLSHGHKVGFSTPEMFIDKERRSASLHTEQFSISFDQHEIFKFQGVHVTSEKNLDVHRQKTPDIQLPSNRALTFSFDDFQIVFPHGYDFAECFEEVKNLNKWRKIVHGVKKKPFTSDSPLPPDVAIKVKTVLVQLCDDPFEVKLGDQYELLVDEHLEKEKRLSALEQRIQELRKRHGLLPAGRVDELYSSLDMRSARVYIDRSQSLYASSPMRNRLFTWTVTDLDITALADPSLHGTENVVKHIQEIDPDSPYPEEGLEFVTLWCRFIRLDVESWKFNLRDFPLPMLDIDDMHVWGRLIGAEQKGQSRALRQCTVEMGAPWGNVTVERNMPALKFYHDFCAELQEYTMAYGPCWEPTWAQNNLSQNLVNIPSSDPSKPMPFWDKFRLLLHGRLTMVVHNMSWLYHVSHNPYNVTEFMDWHWTGLGLDWTNAKWVLKGDLDILVKTASKYDDCRLLHMPNLCFSVGLGWNCLGDPDDHHSVMPCAPDKVPEYSMEEHDSFRAFRSQSFNLNISFQSKPCDDGEHPACLFYASTLRWMDKLKMCFARVSRPICRGKLYNLTKPRKPQFTRHVKNMNVSVDFHKFSVNYWMSRSLTHGTEMAGEKLTLALGMELELGAITDGLIHRPQANWSVHELAAELHNTTVWLHHKPDQEKCSKQRRPASKKFFLCVDCVRYRRAEEKANMTAQEASLDSTLDHPEEEVPRHKVQVYNLKAAWTPINRDVALSLYDGYVKAANVKKNLSSEALKGFRVESMQTPQKLNQSGVKSPAGLSFSVAPSPMTRIQSGPAYSMLQKLVSESDSKFVAVHEELSDSGVQVEQLHGIVACQTNDVVRKNWHVELYNSQVMLRGVETAGYVIVSAAKASLLSCEHKPVWRDQLVHSKMTLVGSIESMQYYATVECGWEDSAHDIRWLHKEHIETVSEAELSVNLTDLDNMIGSGQSVGGVVGTSNQQVGKSDQLQRIISRCRCQFFYAGYGEMEDTVATEVPLPPSDVDPDMMMREEGVDAFSLLHHDLNICTNSLQYKMILDIVNNLLLHTEPKKKEMIEKHQKMRFQMQLASVEDLKTPISKCQENLRRLVARQRHLERKTYLLQQAMREEQNQEEVLAIGLEIEQLDKELKDTKDQASSLGEELSIRVTCFKEAQLRTQYQRQAAKRQKEALVTRRIEVCFKHAEWRMTEADGQIGIADLVLRNFLYTKVNKEDESGSHQLELGFVKVANLLPNPIYKDVLEPQDPQDRQLMLHILCRFRAPVGGISVNEHFEVNVTPLSVQLTAKFYGTVMGYFFPGKNGEDSGGNQSKGSEEKSLHRGSMSSLASNEDATELHRKGSVRKQTAAFDRQDILDQMKVRALKNMFLYIKIPEVLLRVSYKGEKEKGITNIQGFVFLLPTLEYHDQAWSWHDLAIAIKNDLKRGLVAQAVKQKLHIRSRTLLGETFRSEVQEEENKAKLLLGAKLFGGNEKNSSRKTLFKSSKS